MPRSLQRTNALERLSACISALEDWEGVGGKLEHSVRAAELADRLIADGRPNPLDDRTFGFFA